MYISKKIRDMQNNMHFIQKHTKFHDLPNDHPNLAHYVTNGHYNYKFYILVFKCFNYYQIFYKF